MQTTDYRVQSGVVRVHRAYMVAALWSSLDDEGVNLDDAHDVDDIHPDTVADMQEDVASFVQANRDDALAYVDAFGGDWAQLGHDFWLTRNRHGAGFWDRGLGDLGDRLTAAAHPYGEVDLYIGDDGQIHA